MASSIPKRLMLVRNASLSSRASLTAIVQERKRNYGAICDSSYIDGKRSIQQAFYPSINSGSYDRPTNHLMTRYIGKFEGVKFRKAILLLLNSFMIPDLLRGFPTLLCTGCRSYLVRRLVHIVDNGRSAPPVLRSCDARNAGHRISGQIHVQNLFESTYSM